jgi:hypothetical protein
MKIKNLSEEKLRKRLNYLQKTNPGSRWIAYIKYQLKKFS